MTNVRKVSLCGTLLSLSLLSSSVPASVHAAIAQPTQLTQPTFSIHICPQATDDPAACNRQTITLTWGEQKVQPGVYAPKGSLYGAMLEITKPSSAPLFYVWMSLYRGSTLTGVYRVAVAQDGHPLVSSLLVNALEQYSYCEGICPGVYSHILDVARHIVSGTYTLRIAADGQAYLHNDRLPRVTFMVRHIS